VANSCDLQRPSLNILVPCFLANIVCSSRSHATVRNKYVVLQDEEMNVGSKQATIERTGLTGKLQNNTKKCHRYVLRYLDFFHTRYLFGGIASMEGSGFYRFVVIARQAFRLLLESRPDFVDMLMDYLIFIF